jgi:hypothetical protein
MILLMTLLLKSQTPYGYYSRKGSKFEQAAVLVSSQGDPEGRKDWAREKKGTLAL